MNTVPTSYQRFIRHAVTNWQNGNRKDVVDIIVREAGEDPAFGMLLTVLFARSLVDSDIKILIEMLRGREVNNGNGNEGSGPNEARHQGAVAGSHSQ